MTPKPAPFDAVATDYDSEFTNTRLATWLRSQVYDHVRFEAGQHILEIGCGTGVDAQWLAKQEVHVLATDASLEMIRVVETKVQNARLEHLVSTRQLDLNMPEDLPVVFDGVLANFGVLNCVVNRQNLARFLARHTKRDSRVIVVLISPICLWEIIWHLMHGQPRQAARRWRGTVMANVGNGETIAVDYPSIGKLRREFKPYFHLKSVIGIGALLPPSYLSHLAERYPMTFLRFTRWDKVLSQTALWPHISDHYLAEFERT